ncbi:MAG: Holliday junction resolvase RuvX [Actinomycetales bacterium]|nr:Holliday junction resolvase RuvX [Actinomycetales bacterium]
MQVPARPGGEDSADGPLAPAAAAVRPATRLALDPGAVRIGVARSAGSLAFPVGAVVRGEGDVHQICDLAHEHGVAEIVIGIPVSLSGVEGASAEAARAFAAAISTALPGLAVRLVDERLTTVQAAQQMRRAGKSAKEQKSSIDAAAATLLLQHVIDAEAASGCAPGELFQAGAS